MKKQMKNDTGITLVALIITIIILLILAGIVIIYFSKTELLKKAKQTRNIVNNSTSLENTILNSYDSNINKYVIASDREIKSEYQIYETEMLAINAKWTKILDGNFNEESDYIIAYKIYTDDVWQQYSSLGPYVVTFEIKNDGIYSFCNYSGTLGRKVKIIISSFK